jgi:hypothetical protein
MRIISVSIVRTTLVLVSVVVVAGTSGLLGCAEQAASEKPGVPKQLLSGESHAPALFIGSDPSAPVVGFISKDVTVDVAGPSVAGRVPVRVRGALLVRGFVPETLLALRAQRHGKVRGTPVYLGPNDPVMVLGEDREQGRLKVRVMPKVDGVNLPAFEGSFPTVGIAAQPVENAEAPPAGTPHMLPAGTPLALYAQPEGAFITELPAREEQLPVEVLNKEGVWSAVRVGNGPYLVGYTSAYLAPTTPEELAKYAQTKRAKAVAAQTEQTRGAGQAAEIPTRLVSESGELKRIAAGAAVSFGDKVFAKLQKPGFARVLATYPSGEADALIAVDDDVAVRGLVRGSDLSAPDAKDVRVAQ